MNDGFEKMILEGEVYTTASGVKVKVEEKSLVVISSDNKEITRFDEEGKFFKKLLYKSEEQRASENRQRIYNNFFCKIGEKEREEIKKYLENAASFRKKEIDFLASVEYALHEIDYDFWISTIEPTIKDNKLIFARREEIAQPMSLNEWIDKVADFDSEFNSKIARSEEVMLFYAYRLARGWWNLEYICVNSSSDGNYRESRWHSGKCDLTDHQKVGGFNDGVGNTYKIVMMTDELASLYGGSWETSGMLKPVASCTYIMDNDVKLNYAVPIVACTGVKGDLIIQK